MCFLQPCLEAVCFASCGLLVPIIPPITIEWCHQVNITPRLSRCLSVFCFSLSLCTVSWSPLAGMTMAPHLEGHEIAFNASDRKSWKKYARSMDEFLRRESVLHCVNAGGEVVEFVGQEEDIFCVSCSACWEGKPFLWAESSHSVVFVSHSAFVKLL